MHSIQTKSICYTALLSSIISLSGCMLDPAVIAGQIANGGKTSDDYYREQAESARPELLNKMRAYKCDSLALMRPGTQRKYLESRDDFQKVTYESILQAMREKGCATTEITASSAASVASAQPSPTPAAIKPSSPQPNSVEAKAVAKITTKYCRAFLQVPGGPGGVQSSLLVVSFSDNAKAATYKSFSEFITKAQKFQPGKWDSVKTDVEDCNFDGSLCFKFTSETVAQQNCNDSKAVTVYNFKFSKDFDPTIVEVK